MTDLVNAFFRKHYPSDWDTAWESEYCVQGYQCRYKGTEGYGKTIFPEMVCADGFKMSVQGHFGAYSHPRDDFAESYRDVEVMTRPDAEPLLVERGGETNDEWSLYGYVPVETVAAIIEKHGGLKG